MAALLIRSAVWFLPQAWRGRYQNEWLAELDEMRHQHTAATRPALRILLGAPRVGRALRREDQQHPIRRTLATAAISVDIGIPNMARMYDYFLGGGNHFPADRKAAEESMRSGWTSARIAVRENREFLGRTVRYLASEAGIRQFLDIGTGLPSANNVHEVAQAAAPDSRIAYVDNDPIVLARARSLLQDVPQSRIAYVDADLRATDEMQHPANWADRLAC
jgi:hypothetical protein